MTEEVETKVLGLRERSGTENLITLSTGVILRAKPANPITLIDVMAAFPRPKPPMWFNTTMGRMMENSADPDYLERVNARKMEQSDAVLMVLIGWGTELHSKPKGISGPMDDEWLERYSLLGLDMKPENKDWRYLKWVKHVACSDPSDLKLIQEEVGRLSGISKSDVQAAEDFPGRGQTPG